MPISNMQQARQMYEYGGLSAPRQNYGLGSFVKKAVRGVKKVAKSPLGKAALMYAGTAGLGALAGGAGGTGFGMSMFRPSNIMSNFGGSNMFGKLKSGKGFLGNVGNMFRTDSSDPNSKFSMGKMALGGLGAASLAPLLMGGGGDDDVEDVVQLDPNAAVQSAKNYYSGQGNAGAGLNFMPQKKYVNQNFYAADGGRAGYANGQLVSPSNNGFRPGYAGERVSTEGDLFRKLPVGNPTDRFLMPDNVPKQNKKFDFMFETGPITDRNLEILKNMTEEERKAFEEQGSPFDIIEQFIKIPFQIRGEEIIKEGYAQGGRAGYAMGGMTDEEEEFMRSGAGQRRIMPQTFLAMGGGAGEAQAEQMLQAEFIKYKNRGGELSFQEFVQAVMQQQQQAQGMQQPTMAANGGRMGYAEGGIMDTEAAEMIDMGGQEKDYRDEGGFVAMGGEERADDVPARLSKNEFVFTADAVRQAGGGDIDRGSEVMQNMMDNLEQGGQISQGSQGLGGEEEVMEEPDGAQAMYEQQQALQSRMA
jgi:hypothetical protein